MREKERGSVKSYVLTALTLPFVLLLSACPPPVESPLATAVSDKLPPKITVASPRNGQTYSATVTVTGSVTDDALSAGDGKGSVVSIDYEVANDVLRKGKILINADGTAKQDTTFGSGVIAWTAATKTFSFAISTVSPTTLRGLITITINATDANGNTSDSVMQLSEAAGPLITIQHPSSTELKYLPGSTLLTLTGTVANAVDDPASDSNIASVSWGVIGKTWAGTINVVAGTTSYSVANTGSCLPRISALTPRPVHFPPNSSFRSSMIRS